MKKRQKNLTADSRATADQGFGKPTEWCVAKQAPFLLDLLLDMEAKSDRRVHH